MNNDQLQDQVDSIRQTFGYIREFRGATFVIKIDSSLIQNEDSFPVLLRDIVLLHTAGIQIILVPGAKQRIDQILSHFNISCATVGGRRISTPEAIPFVKMAAFDVSNRLMTLLAENKENAVIGNWVRARSLGVSQGIDYQCTGTIDKIDGPALQNVLEDEVIPIIPNIGWSLSGHPYNISSNELAYEISCAVKSEKLFFLTDAPPISSSTYKLLPDMETDEAGRISSLSTDQIEPFISLNTHKGVYDTNMELLTYASRASKKGVKRVHLIHGCDDGVLLQEIFSNRGAGTMIHRDLHENIRPAQHTDIADILRITAPLIKEGILLHRSYEDIQNALSEYYVYEIDKTLHGCGALRKYSDGSYEIYSVAVDKSYASLGTGKQLLSYLTARAEAQRAPRVFLLTTQTIDWFLNLGFTEAHLADLPAEKAASYNHGRSSRILIKELSAPRQRR
ncbi:amino-acid N-acetyltransferase [Chitinivibrio alkaliphilus]|uniref:amino-acid N-acetyltransferase n=1 Tax=Chitinivibrio alkaliphilus ACht1 TaxID=1313304 RepID=U7D2M2_9BACT|nr:amino-acid N-acetyltransferase [Chitinivibrio alkaliphilus]ERP30759.1 amino-acid N-acetyltransferase [Chitinivibrio alkaliphilus ACht1]